MLHLRLFLFTAILSALSSCKKDELSINGVETPSLATSLLQKVVSTGNGNYTTEYIYDNEKRPIKVVFSSSMYTWKNIVDIEYQSGSKLKKAIYRTVDSSNLPIESIVSYTFIYDNNKVVKRIATPLKSGHNEDDHTYSYDAQGRLIADSTLNRQTAKAYRYSKYYWDNNNVVKNEDYVSDINGAFGLGSYWEYNYDGNKNPYYTLPVYFINNYVGFYLSQGNITGFKHGDDVMTTYVNQYNNTGLLTRTEYRPVANLNLFATYEYYYIK